MTLEELVEYLRAVMTTMSDAERVTLIHALMAGYCPRCGARQCKCEFWMEH